MKSKIIDYQEFCGKIKIKQTDGFTCKMSTELLKLNNTSQNGYTAIIKFLK